MEEENFKLNDLHDIAKPIVFTAVTRCEVHVVDPPPTLIAREATRVRDSRGRTVAGRSHKGVVTTGEAWGFTETLG